MGGGFYTVYKGTVMVYTCKVASWGFYTVSERFRELGRRVGTRGSEGLGSGVWGAFLQEFKGLQSKDPTSCGSVLGPLIF